MCVGVGVCVGVCACVCGSVCVHVCTEYIHDYRITVPSKAGTCLGMGPSGEG